MTDISGVVPPAPPRSAPHTRLSRREKAAIIVRFLLNEGADVRLADLPEDLQALLTRQIGGMSYVDRETLAGVVMEFARELETVGLSFPEDIGGAIDALDGTLSPGMAARLRKEAGMRAMGDPWKRLGALDSSQLCEIVAAERTGVAAVILSKLDVAKAAEVLGLLPGADARRIALAVQDTAGIAAKAVDRIGHTLLERLDARPPLAFDAGADSRLGAILNMSSEAVRGDLLAGIEAENAEFAQDVRRAIFTFADIPQRLRTRDIPAVMREVDPAVLVTALVAADGDATAPARDFILSGLPGRLADQIREDMGERGKVGAQDGETAMTAVVGAIRAAAEDGSIVLEQPDPEG